MLEASKAEVGNLQRDFQSLRERFDQSQRDLNVANSAIQTHLATINRLDRENTIHQLKAGETLAQDPVAAAS